MEGLPVSYSLNSGDNGNNWWGDFIGAAIGGAAGAAWGRGNNNGCCGNGGGGCCNNNDQFIMDTLTTMRTDVNGIGRDQLIQTQQIGQGICQGFGGIATEIANLGSQLSQGQCRTEAAVLTTGLNGQIQQKDNTIAQLNASHAAEMQGMRNTFDIVSSQKDCCCTTNANIERQAARPAKSFLLKGAPLVPPSVTNRTRPVRLSASLTANSFSVNLRPRMPRLLSSKPSSSIPLLPQAMRSRPAMKCRARPRSFSQRFVTARRPPLAVHPPKSSL